MGHVVVTGALGFVGLTVVRKLVAQGRNVLAVVQPQSETADLELLNVETLSADVLDTAALAQACEGAEAFYHLAAVHRTATDTPAMLYRVNVEGATAALLAAQKARVPRVVFSSSAMAIGLRQGQQLSDESVAFNLFDVANDHLLTKHLSERLAYQFAQAGVPVVIVCPTFPFGAGDRGPSPVGNLIKDICQGTIPGYPPGGINVIDVDEVAAGHLLAEHKGVVGQRYVLGDHNVTLEEFVRAVAEVSESTVPDRKIPASLALATSWLFDRVARHITHSEPRATPHVTRYALKYAFFDCEKARQELGLRSTPLRDTVSRAILWFRNRGYL